MKTQTRLCRQSLQDPATQHVSVPKNAVQTLAQCFRESGARRAWLSQAQKPVFWINCFSKLQDGRKDNCVVLQPFCSRVCSLGQEELSRIPQIAYFLVWGTRFLFLLFLLCLPSHPMATCQSKCLVYRTVSEGVAFPFPPASHPPLGSC